MRRRIAPSHDMSLDLVDDDGTKFTIKFRLSFDMNVIVLIEEMTGLGVANGEIWDYLSEQLSRGKDGPKREYRVHPSVSMVVSTMLWAAAQPHHGADYDSEEGLRVIRSYMDFNNFAFIAFELEKAFVASIPKEKRDAMKKAEGGDSPLAQESPQTGSESGPSPATSESQKKSSAA